MATGRFAPSPTGRLHLGNLRTAFAAWLLARSAGSAFLLRMEDLDGQNSSVANERLQMGELLALGLDWDGEIVRQSDRFAIYDDAIATLEDRGLTYPCFCSRKDIAQAGSAPHGPRQSTYPGTCSSLSPADRRARAEQRPAALRLRAQRRDAEFVDRLAGTRHGLVDDVVLRRNDGVPSYNLAVVLDDHLGGVEEVLRGDDLIDATFSQIHIAELLGLGVPRHAHIPLVIDRSGARLSKRSGAITLEDVVPTFPVGLEGMVAMLASSLGITGSAQTAAEALEQFDPDAIPDAPWIFDPQQAAGSSGTRRPNSSTT